MPFQFSERSLTNLKGVHADLVAVTHLALELSSVDFGVIEGIRTAARQAELYEAKKSQTLNSRHLYGLAIDFMAYVDGAGTWEEKYYVDVAYAFQTAAYKLLTPIVWGGRWKMQDLDHIELDRAHYPDAPLIA